MACRKCKLLLELYERTPKSPRDYWVMTELFVELHQGDICRDPGDSWAFWEALGLDEEEHPVIGQIGKI